MVVDLNMNDCLIGVNMEASIDIRFNGAYITLEILPDHKINPASDRYMWLETASACKTHKCRKVLLEGPVPEINMQEKDAVVSGKWMARLMAGTRVACCLTGAPPDDVAGLFFNTAYNRGVDIKFFPSKIDGLEWLCAADSQG